MIKIIVGIKNYGDINNQFWPTLLIESPAHAAFAKNTLGYWVVQLAALSVAFVCPFLSFLATCFYFFFETKEYPPLILGAE